MTSLLLGIVCIYLSFTVLRLPDEKFRDEITRLTGKGPHSEGYYKVIRGLFWALGGLGMAMILLRFFD